MDLGQEGAPQVDFRTVTMWLAILAAILALVGLLRAQAAAADAKSALDELDHDNTVQTWTYRRDQAVLCIRSWDRYEDVGRIYVDIPEAIISYSQQQGGASPTVEQLIAFRAVFAEAFGQYPPPECDREEAMREERVAIEQLANLSRES